MLDNAAMADRIRTAIEKSGLTQEAVAQSFGVSVQAVSGWVRTGKVDKRKLPRLAQLTDKPLSYFIPDAPDGAPGAGGWDDVIGYAQAAALGDGSIPEDYAETHALKFKASSLGRKNLRADKLAVYYGDGDSMEPTIETGDAILFDTSDTRLQDGKIFMVRYDGHITAKRMVKLGRAWFLSSDNNEDPKWRKPVPVDETKDFEVIGRVRWIAGWED